MAESYNITAILNAKIDGLVNGFKQATSTVDDFVKRNEKTFDSFKQVGKVATGAGLTIATGLGFAVKTAANFEAAMSQVKAISGATGRDFDNLRDKAVEMGNATMFSASESADAMANLAQMGWETDQILGGIEHTLNLAAAGGLELAESAMITANTMNQFGLEAEEAERVADALAYTAASAGTDVEEMGAAMEYAGANSAAAGMSIEETAAFIGVLGDAGITGSKAGTSLNAMLRDLKKNSDDGAIAVGKQSVALYDAEGNMRDMPTVISEIIKATKGMSTEQRDAALSSILGEQALNGFNAIAGQGADAVSNLTEELYDSKGSASDMADVMQDNLNGALTALGSAFEGVQIAIGSALIPAIRKVTEFMKSLADKFNDLDEKTKTIIAVVAALAAGFLLIVGPILLLIGFLPSIIAGLKALGLVLGTLFSPIGLIVIGIVALIAAIVLAYNKIEWFRDGVNAVWEFIKFSIQYHIDLIMQIIDVLLDWVMEIWEEHGEEFISAVMAIWDTIVEAIQTAIEFVQEIIEMITDYINEIWEEHGEFIMAVIDKVWTTIKDLIKLHLDLIWNNIKTVMNIIKGVFEVVWPIISNIIKVAWNLIKAIVKTAIDLVAGIIKTVMSLIRGDWSGAWNSIKDTITKIWDNIIGFFKSVDLVQIGKDIIKGLIKGISSMVGAVADAVKNVTSKITGTVKKILGIKSPSRVFMGFGDNISEGLANGIDNAARLAEKASEKLGIGVEGAFNPQLAVDGVDIADQVNDVNRQTKRQFSNHMTSEVDIGRQAIEINIYDNKESVRAYVNENNAIDSTIRRFDDWT